MQYCSIDDAWGNSTITNNFKNYTNSNIENFENNESQSNNLLSQDNKKIIPQIDYEPYKSTLVEKQTDNIITCDDVILHIKNCKYCQDKVKSYFRPNIVDNLYDTIDNHKDIIVLILIGISILLFFNLINNLTK
jgi:hypothetical protein